MQHDQFGIEYSLCHIGDACHHLLNDSIHPEMVNFMGAIWNWIEYPFAELTKPLIVYLLNNYSMHGLIGMACVWSAYWKMWFSKIGIIHDNIWLNWAMSRLSINQSERRLPLEQSVF